jgi:hypothetical protein
VPQIIVTADGRDHVDDDGVMLRERVNVSDFESAHFAAQLVERLGWAVGDASAAEWKDDSAPVEEPASTERESVRVG